MTRYSCCRLLRPDPVDTTVDPVSCSPPLSATPPFRPIFHQARESRSVVTVSSRAQAEHPPNRASTHLLIHILPSPLSYSPLIDLHEDGWDCTVGTFLPRAQGWVLVAHDAPSVGVITARYIADTGWSKGCLTYGTKGSL